MRRPTVTTLAKAAASSTTRAVRQAYAAGVRVGAAREREACARLVEARDEPPAGVIDTGLLWRNAAIADLAAAIRARKGAA